MNAIKKPATAPNAFLLRIDPRWPAPLLFLRLDDTFLGGCFSRLNGRVQPLIPASDKESRFKLVLPLFFTLSRENGYVMGETGPSG